MRLLSMKPSEDPRHAQTERVVGHFGAHAGQRAQMLTRVRVGRPEGDERARVTLGVVDRVKHPSAHVQSAHIHAPRRSVPKQNTNRLRGISPEMGRVSEHPLPPRAHREKKEYDVLLDSVLCLNGGGGGGGGSYDDDDDSTDAVVCRRYDAATAASRTTTTDGTVVQLRAMIYRCVFGYGLTHVDTRRVLFGTTLRTKRYQQLLVISVWEGGSRFVSSLYALVDTLHALTDEPVSAKTQKKKEEGWDAVLRYEPLLRNIRDTCARTERLPNAQTTAFVRTFRARVQRLVHKAKLGRAFHARVETRYRDRCRDAEKTLLAWTSHG